MSGKWGLSPKWRTFKRKPSFPSNENSNSEALEHSNQQLRKSNLELEKARQKADQANQAKGIFLATMSHEIRPPMNGVLGMSALLVETTLTEEQQMFTETIITCGETLIHVINDILDFSKIESWNLELEREDFDLRHCRRCTRHFETASSLVLTTAYQLLQSTEKQLS